jgi:hypothetical protein
MRWKELLEFERLFARNIFDIKDEKNGPMIKLTTGKILSSLTSI